MISYDSENITNKIIYIYEYSGTKSAKIDEGEEVVINLD